MRIGTFINKPLNRGKNHCNRAILRQATQNHKKEHRSGLCIQSCELLLNTTSYYTTPVTTPAKHFTTSGYEKLYYRVTLIWWFLIVTFTSYFKTEMLLLFSCQNISSCFFLELPFKSPASMKISFNFVLSSAQVLDTISNSCILVHNTFHTFSVQGFALVYSCCFVKTSVQAQSTYAAVLHLCIVAVLAHMICLRVYCCSFYGTH